MARATTVKAEPIEETGVITEPESITPPIQEMFSPFRGNYCPNCEEKFLTNLEGEAFCPIKHQQCPRNKPQ